MNQGAGQRVLVLGILGLLCFGTPAPTAWIVGSQANRAIADWKMYPSEKTLVNIGRMLGIVGTIALIV